MNIAIDLRSAKPIYLQLVEKINQQIANGDLKTGDQLPTLRALALKLSINFNTVSRAYRMLDEAGIISTQQGRGTYILEMPLPESAERIRLESMDAITRNYIDQAQRLGFTFEQITERILIQSMTFE
ncbi:MAG: GntR family transcriptional regulator [Chloroflexi bacterium]|nr:GntR family transcriptional regulator [Chloroflexota bacterium]